MKRKFIIRLIILVIIILMPTIVNANSDIVVMLDPGHGGFYDVGAISGGLRETDITWKIGTEVKKILDNTPGITGILTRGENSNPEIYQRGDMAKEYGADLMVSFHINSSESSLPRGSEVYVTRNDRVDRFYKNSNTLAVNILNNLANIGIPRNGSYLAKLRPTESGNMYPDGTYADYYGIIRYPMNYGIPSVLIEHCFISNPYDRDFINNDAMIQKIAQADAQAIIENKELFRIDKTKNSVKGAFDSIYYDSNSGSIKGTVLYNEVVNDMPVDIQPIVSIVSEDGCEKLQGTVSKKSSYTYEYNINIMNLNPYKEYRLQVETQYKNSIPINNVLKINLPNEELGTIYGMNITTKDNKILFDAPYYDGYMTNGPYSAIELKGNILSGDLIVQEWINGTKQEQPKVNPKVVLKDEDGNEIKCTVTYKEPYVYHYEIDLAKVDINKKYEIEVQSGTDKNISDHTKVKVIYEDQKIGIYDNIYVVKMEDSKLSFTYDGYMTNGPYSEITLKGTTMTGRLIIQEWIDGTKQIEPTSLPKIVLKGTSGGQIEGSLKYIEPYVYEYQFDISKLSKEESYEMEVQCTNKDNISDHKDVVVNYSDRTIGKVDNYNLKYKGNKIIFEEINNKYNGYMTNGPYSEITLKGTTMTGRLIIQEWIDGTKQVEPTSLPKIVLKGTSGGQIEGSLKYIEPYVYEYQFDISKLSKEESYEMEVQCTNKDNISDHKDVVVNYSDRTIGKIDNYNLIIEENKFLLETK